MDRGTRQISEALAVSQNPQNTQNTLWLIEATPIEIGDSLIDSAISAPLPSLSSKG
jgi:hypothetical protein